MAARVGGRGGSTPDRRSGVHRVPPAQLPPGLGGALVGPAVSPTTGDLSALLPRWRDQGPHPRWPVRAGDRDQLAGGDRGRLAGMDVEELMKHLPDLDRSGLSPSSEDHLGWLALLTGTDCWKVWWALVFKDISVLTPEERDRLGRAVRASIPRR